MADIFKHLIYVYRARDRDSRCKLKYKCIQVNLVQTVYSSVYSFYIKWMEFRVLDIMLMFVIYKVSFVRPGGILG